MLPKIFLVSAVASFVFGLAQIPLEDEACNVDSVDRQLLQKKKTRSEDLMSLDVAYGKHRRRHRRRRMDWDGKWDDEQKTRDTRRRRRGGNALDKDSDLPDHMKKFCQRSWLDCGTRDVHQWDQGGNDQAAKYMQSGFKKACTQATGSECVAPNSRIIFKETCAFACNSAEERKIVFNRYKMIDTYALIYQFPKDLLSSYWDEGNCGPKGDDFQAGWCKWNRKQNCDENAEITVAEAKPFCSDGKLKVTYSKGDGWKNGKLEEKDDNNCYYNFRVFFKCQKHQPKVLHVGSSKLKKKCVIPFDKEKNQNVLLTCRPDSGNRGSRVNQDFWDYNDEFKVTSGDKVCVERKGGDNWDMDLKLACFYAHETR